MHITALAQTAKQKKEVCGLGRICTKDFPSPADPTLECIDAYFNENYMEVEDDDDE